MDRNSARRTTGFALAVVLLVGVAALARFHEIGRRSIWFDEGATLGMLRLPLGEFLRNAWRSVGLNNQFLYYLVLRPWHLLGEEESTLRAFSAIFSTGAVALTCILGRRLFGTAAGLSAGAILAMHGFAIRTAQEARAYGLTAFLVSLAALLLVRYLELGRRRDLVGWTLASGLAVYAHFFAIFPVAAQALSLLALGRAPLEERRGVLAGLAGIALLALPVVLFLAFQAPPGLLNWVPPVDLLRLIGLGAVLSGGRLYLLLLYAFLFAVLLVRAFGEPRPVKRWGAALVLLWAIFPTSAMAVISLWHPVLVERYVSMSVPGWALVAGAVIGPLLERRRRALPGLALLGFVLLSEMERYRDLYTGGYEDWRTPAAWVAASTLPGDAILYNSPWSGLAFGYYLDRAPLRPEPLQRGPLVFTGAFDPADAMGRERVWVVLSRDDADFEPAIRGLLEGTHPVVNRRDFGFMRVLLLDGTPRRDGEGAFGRSIR